MIENKFFVAWCIFTLVYAIIVGMIEFYKDFIK